MQEQLPTDAQALQVTLAFPPALVTRIADALAERLADGDLAPARSPWLDVQGAADYLEMTQDAVRKAALRGLLPAPSARARATSSTAESSTSSSSASAEGGAGGSGS
jgi:hypothetical protein